MGLIKEFLGHADTRSTERYAKLAAPTLVQLLRPVDRGAGDKPRPTTTKPLEIQELSLSRTCRPLVARGAAARSAAPKAQRPYTFLLATPRGDVVDVGSSPQKSESGRARGKP